MVRRLTLLYRSIANWSTGNHGRISGDAGGGESTGNTVQINGSAPTLFERNVIINGVPLSNTRTIILIKDLCAGGQGGNGGEGGGIGGAGGTGEGNHVQIHLSDGEITVNVHYPQGRDQDLEFVIWWSACVALGWVPWRWHIFTTSLYLYISEATVKP